MKEHLSAGRLQLWISEKDKRGNRVRQDVIEAATDLEPCAPVCAASRR